MLFSIFPFLGNLKSLADLADTQTQTFALSQTARRRNYKIAVIDDDVKLSLPDLLRQRHFAVSTFHNARDMDPNTHFHAYICDIMGIADESHNKGVSTMKEIKKNSPFSYLIAHSAARENTGYVQEAKKYADTFIPKNMDIDDVVNDLDSELNKRFTPAGYWKLVRNHLLEKNVDIKALVLMEHFWVKAEQQDDYKIFEKGIKKISATTDFSDDLSNVLKFGFSATKLALTVSGSGSV